MLTGGTVDPLHSLSSCFRWACSNRPTASSLYTTAHHDKKWLQSRKDLDWTSAQICYCSIFSSDKPLSRCCTSDFPDSYFGSCLFNFWLHYVHHRARMSTHRSSVSLPPLLIYDINGAAFLRFTCLFKTSDMWRQIRASPSSSAVHQSSRLKSGQKVFTAGPPSRRAVRSQVHPDVGCIQSKKTENKDKWKNWQNLVLSELWHGWILLFNASSSWKSVQ